MTFHASGEEPRGLLLITQVLATLLPENWRCLERCWWWANNPVLRCTFPALPASGVIATSSLYVPNPSGRLSCSSSLYVSTLCRLSSWLQLDCLAEGDACTKTLGSIITPGSKWHHITISILPVDMRPLYQVGIMYI